MKIEVGDWVRFYQNGLLVLGEVRYIQPHSWSDNGNQYCTDRGTINSQDILEVRPPNKETR